MALNPCLRCGRIVNGSTCDPCKRASPYQRPAWRALSRAVVQRDGACGECGSTRYLAAHHIIPRAEGGADHPDNLLTLCASCHARAEARERRRVA